MAAPMTTPAQGEDSAGPPALTYGQLFGRFLRCGLLAGLGFMLPCDRWPA